jgi:hypothetical protein
MSRRSLLTRLLLSVSLTATIGAAAAEGPAPRFDWPDGLVMDASARIHGARTAGAETLSSWDAQGTSRWSVRRDGGRTFIERAPFSGWDGTQPPANAALPFRVVDHVPTLVIGRDGTFLGAEGLEAARGRIRGSLPGLADTPPGIRSVIDAALADPGLRAMTGDFWSMLIGAWLMAGAEVHEGFEFTQRTAVPQLGGGELDLRGKIELQGISDCARGGVTRRCGTFHILSSADQAQVRALLEKLLASTVGQGFRFVGFEQQMESTVVAELDGLVPHRMTLRQQSSIEAEQDGERQKVTEVSSKDYVFTHTAP